MTIVNTATAPFAMEQPGRMFNKALQVDLEAPLTHHRRKLHQVCSYHDLDDLSTIATRQQPEMKCSGSVKIERRGSPVSVTDVKRFDASIVPPPEYEDAGGVSIDLCLPETHTIHTEEARLPLVPPAQPSPAPQQQQQPPQMRELPPRRHSPSFLAPIFEERRVTFAAQHVVTKVETDDDNSCAIDQRFVHQVFDAVQVWFIPHFSEYNEEDRANVWYSKDEMSSMKERAIEAKRSKRMEEARKKQQQERDEQEQRFESQLDTCSLFPSSRKRSSTPTKKQHRSKKPQDSLEAALSERRFRYEEMVDAVLLEQYEQRLMCLRVYGRVDEEFTGIIDADRLARVCAVAGDTRRSHERALAKAREALQDTDEDDQEEESERSLQDFQKKNTAKKTSKAAASVSGSSKQHPKLKRTPSFNSSALAVETSNLFNRGIGSLFEVLLSPFLEIRQGDLFLGIGEEMTVMI